MAPSLRSLLLSSASSDNDPQPDLRSKPLILVKIWCLVIVFVVTLVAGVLPYLMKWKEGFIHLGTLFAGGVFLGTALMQFLGDSDDAFERLTSKGYPFAFMLACVGYLLAMLADVVIVHVHQNRRRTITGGVELQGVISQRKYPSGEGTSRTQSSNQVIDDEIDRHYMDPSLFTTISFSDSVLLIVSLCFYSIFQGIAIGITPTKSKAWRALWTVTLHRAFAAISMGITLLRTGPEPLLLSCISYAFCFAISCPLGVVVGIVIDSTAHGVVGDWIFAVAMGLCGGVFVYVCVHHLMVKRRVAVDGQREFLAVVLGVSVVAVLMIWDS